MVSTDLDTVLLMKSIKRNYKNYPRGRKIGIFNQNLLLSGIIIRENITSDGPINC